MYGVNVYVTCYASSLQLDGWMRIGVRGSKLALAYAQKAIDAIGEGEIEIIKYLDSFSFATLIAAEM